MKVLVAYASRHGATWGIAETVERNGLDVAQQPVEADEAIDQYDAFVIGGAAYMGRWLREATQFVQRHGWFMASRPVWLFSSGPVGAETVDAKGRDVLEASAPKEFAEIAGAIHPRDLVHRIPSVRADTPPEYSTRRIFVRAE